MVLNRFALPYHPEGLLEVICFGSSQPYWKRFFPLLHISSGGKSEIPQAPVSDYATLLSTQENLTSYSLQNKTILGVILSRGRYHFQNLSDDP
jgi:hypothetical protein